MLVLFGSTPVEDELILIREVYCVDLPLSQNDTRSRFSYANQRLSEALIVFYQFFDMAVRHRVKETPLNLVLVKDPDQGGRV